jgi:hypothetical protein
MENWSIARLRGMAVSLRNIKLELNHIYFAEEIEVAENKILRLITNIKKHQENRAFDRKVKQEPV